MMDRSPVEALRNRGSVPDDSFDIHDTACITSSSWPDALRHAHAFVTLPARKQTGTQQPNHLSTSRTNYTHLSLQHRALETLQQRFHIPGQIGWGISNGSAPPTCGNPLRSFPQAPRCGARDRRAPIELCSRARNSDDSLVSEEQRRWAVILTPGCPQHLQKPVSLCPQASGGQKTSREAGTPAPRGA